MCVCYSCLELFFFSRTFFCDKVLQCCAGCLALSPNPVPPLNEKGVWACELPPAFHAKLTDDEVAKDVRVGAQISVHASNCCGSDTRLLEKKNGAFAKKEEIV